MLTECKIQLHRSKDTAMISAEKPAYDTFTLADLLEHI